MKFFIRTRKNTKLNPVIKLFNVGMLLVLPVISLKAVLQVTPSTNTSKMASTHFSSEMARGRPTDEFGSICLINCKK